MGTSRDGGLDADALGVDWESSAFSSFSSRGLESSFTFASSMARSVGSLRVGFGGGGEMEGSHVQLDGG